MLIFTKFQKNRLNDLRGNALCDFSDTTGAPRSSVGKISLFCQTFDIILNYLISKTSKKLDKYG